MKPTIQNAVFKIIDPTKPDATIATKKGRPDRIE
jgi:hypothetical protein